jgi:hypothetical protein
LNENDCGYEKETCKIYRDSVRWTADNKISKEETTYRIPEITEISRVFKTPDVVFGQE